jgi:plastocyanin domain-containing protein
MKFVAMRFMMLVLAVVGLTSCSSALEARQVDQGCALFTSAKSLMTGFVVTVQGIFDGDDEKYGNPDEVQKPVTKQLKYKNQEGVVEVVMKVDEKGNWKVVNMAATNEELAKYVLTKLKDYNQTSHKAVGQVIKYRFVFKKQV